MQQPRLEPRLVKFQFGNTSAGSNVQMVMQHVSDHLNVTSISGRDEVTEAIEKLAEEVALLARKLNQDVAVTNTERPRTFKKAELKAALNCAFAALPDTEGVTHAPLSPQRSTERVAKAVDEPNADFSIVPCERKLTGCGEENAIAARVAELYDRLGGFMKPTSSKPSDHDA